MKVVALSMCSTMSFYELLRSYKVAGTLQDCHEKAIFRTEITGRQYFYGFWYKIIGPDRTNSKSIDFLL